MQGNNVGGPAVQAGMIAIAPLVLLLSAAVIVVHATTERGLRVQQYQSAQRALTAAYADSANTRQRVVSALRTSTPEHVEAQLAFANASVTGFKHTLPSGSPVTAFKVSYEIPIRPGLAHQKYHFDILRYSMLRRRPAATLIASSVLPPSTHITVVSDGTRPQIAARAHQNLPPNQLRHCPDRGPGPCPVFPLAALSAPPESVLLQLFNRDAQSMTAADFIGAREIRHCDDLGRNESNVIWVYGDCHLAVNQTVGAQDTPVLLIIENGDLRLAPAATLTGLVLLLRKDSDLPTGIHTAAGAWVTGALIVTAPLRAGVTINLAAAPAVLATLQHSPALAKTTLIPGSWRDFD